MFIVNDIIFPRFLTYNLAVNIDPIYIIDIFIVLKSVILGLWWSYAIYKVSAPSQQYS